MDRFWSKVRKDGPTMPNMDSPCWEWTRAKDGNGYGGFWFDGRMRKAHRVSALWAGIISDISDGDCVLHECDNPACVNPDHLWRGSQADNMEDMKRKGRGSNRDSKGSANNRSKLTEDDVRCIKNLLLAGARQNLIAKQFGVSATQITNIKLGKRWSHV
ncbi:MAG: hypothetical protein L7S70_01665 [Pseudomonadales bacterium]|nr:hypothetical protein [Pseudomonadales bacterium]